jgi:hypothetical protein
MSPEALWLCVPEGVGDYLQMTKETATMPGPSNTAGHDRLRRRSKTYLLAGLVVLGALLVLLTAAVLSMDHGVRSLRIRNGVYYTYGRYRAHEWPRRGPMLMQVALAIDLYSDDCAISGRTVAELLGPPTPDSAAGQLQSALADMPAGYANTVVVSVDTATLL